MTTGSSAIQRLDALPAVRRVDTAQGEDLGALIAAGEPVVIAGLIERWPALAAGRASPGALCAYLASLGAGAAAPVMEAPPSARGHFGYAPGLREFSFTRRQRPLGETLDRILRTLGDAAAPCVAIQMLAMDAHLPAFTRDNPAPRVPAGTVPKLWIGGPVRTQIHNDRDHNLACVIAGRRRFVLFPPDQVANLYIGPLENPPPLSLVDPEAPDLDRFPRFGAALDTARVAHLSPGDALLMPRHWWHHVASIDPFNAMVNYWWGTPARGVEDPNDCFLTALLAIRDLPAAERGYWAAMFAAHVFGDGEAAAHLPGPVRGILGPMRPHERAALRRRLEGATLKNPR